MKLDYYLRPPRKEDARALSDLRRMPGVFENVLGVPTNRDDQTEHFIAHFGSNDHHLLAVVRSGGGEETVIGICSILVCDNPRRRHSGTLGMMVHADYQNRGVGSALLAAILDVADNWLKLVRVELEVFADNQRAIHLYEKLGFEREGVKRAGAIRHGIYADELFMARIRDK